jgi:hypothetical protein
MRKPSWLACLVAGLISISLAPCLFAQQVIYPGKGEDDVRDRSHLLDLVPLPASGDPRELLEQRLQGKRNQNIADQLKRYGIGPEVLEKLKAQLKDDPRFKQKLKDLKPDDLPIPEDLRDTLKKLQQSDRSMLDSKLNQQFLDDLKQRLEPKKQADESQPAPQPEGQGTAPDAQSDSPQPSPPARPGLDAASSQNDGAEKQSGGADVGSPLARGLRGLAQRLGGLNSSLNGSAALQGAVRELGRHIGEPDQRWEQLGRGANALSERWGTLRDALHLDRLVPSSDSPWLARLMPRSLPSRLGEQALARPRLADTGPGNGGARSWSALLALLGLAAVAYAVWKVLDQWHFGHERSAAEEWDAGPWPVDPARVATRGELVQAFEHLSLLVLGRAARAWNHREIAEQLGHEESRPRPGQSPQPPLVVFPNGGERRLVAKELATLYEQARYSPPGDYLPDQAFAAARSALCRFAGVSPS